MTIRLQGYKKIRMEEKENNQKPKKLHFCLYCDFQSEYRQNKYRHVTAFHLKEIQEQNKRKVLKIKCFGCLAEYENASFVWENVCSVCNVCYFCACQRDGHMRSHIVVNSNPFVK